MKESILDVLIIGPFPNPITGNSIANKVAFEGLMSRPGIKVRKINTSTSFFDEKVGFFSIRKLFNSLKFNLQGYKIIQSNIVYITPGQSFLGILKYAILIFIAKLLKRKIILHVHGNYLWQEYQNLNPIKKYIAKFILSLADCGIVLSELLIPNLTPFINRKKIHIVHNFVEDYVINETKESINKKNLGSLRIIYLSNLMLEKGILDLLEALKVLEQEGISFEARIAGNIDNRSRHEIERHFKILNNVTYLGVVDGDAKRDMLLWGNVFVFPTYYKMEGQPLAILEAMATGNVILTSDHAGIPDIFSLNNGLFINTKNPKDIIQKIQTIMNNKEKFEKIMRYNHLYVSRNFRNNKFICSLEGIVKSV